MALREYDFENIPTVSIVKKTLTEAIKMEATDIHFDPTPDELIIKFRINGDLKEYTIAPENVKTNIITRIKIIAGMNINDSLLPQTGTINFELDNKTHNMQVSSLPVLDGEKIVVHISNYARNIKSLSNIGFTENNTKKIKNLLKEQQGIILVTGNTNSGKTTTTYSLLKELNSKTNNIISIEDPVKMKIKGINQVQIAPEKGLTYKNVLKSVMLQDPNVIAINELVDDETTRAALRASVSGRLVISTMHTKTSYQTIDTLLNMDIENYLLGSNLIGVISQRLVKKLCPTCRERKHVTPYEASVIKEILGTDVTEIYYPNGCSECNDGYVGQIPIAEVIEIDEELRNAISNNKKRELIKNIINENTDSIIKDGFKKVIEGKTSFEEIIRILDLRVDLSDEDKKIKNIILGNGTASEEIKNETKTAEVEKEENINIEKSPTEERPFIKVEIDTPEDNVEKNNITNLQISENELKTMLSQIEESAINHEEEKATSTELNKEENSINNSTSDIEGEKKEEKVELEEMKKEEPIEEKTDTEEKNEMDNSTPNEAQTNNSDTFTPESESPIIIQPEEKEKKIQLNNIGILNKNFNINNETSTAKEENNIDSVETKTESIPSPTENTISEEEKENIEINIPQAEEIKETTPSIQPINFDDDDDDDNFNYGDSYINNF